MKHRFILFTILLILISTMLGGSLLRSNYESQWSGRRYLMGGMTSALPDEFIIESTLPSGLTVTARYGLMRTRTINGIVSPKDQRYEHVIVTGRNWFWLLPEYGESVAKNAEAELDTHLKQLGVAAISSDIYSQNRLAKLKSKSKRIQSCPPNSP